MEIGKPTEKDDDTMKFTITTAKAAVRDYIQQAVDKKVIDKSWLEKFDNGTMTSGDFEGLKIIIEQRSKIMLVSVNSLKPAKLKFSRAGLFV